MELNIYRQDGSVKLTVSPGSSSTVTEEIGGDCMVSVSFTLPYYATIDVNDYVEVDGIRYKAKLPYRPQQKSTREYTFSVNFYAPIHDAERATMFNLTEGMNPDFALDGPPLAHIEKWVENMNRLGMGTWTIGTVIDAEYKTIEYRNITCWEAAFGSAGIAETFGTEMWADGRIINLCKCERGVPVELGYMQGLTSLLPEERNDNTTFFTRLIPLGSTRNIDSTEYGYDRLQLPDRSVYVDSGTETYGIYEHIEEEAFSEIYPKYIGTVTSVTIERPTGADGKQYEVYYFGDRALPFNPNDYTLPGLVKMVSFTDGEMAGHGDDENKSFQVNWDEDRQMWEIINTYLEDGTQIPGGNIVPEVGDHYFPWNIRMPESYYTEAEQLYKEAVDDFIAQYSVFPTVYNLKTDYIYCRKNTVSLRIGQNVKLLSEQYFTEGYHLTRMTKVVRKLNNLTEADVACSSQIGKSWSQNIEGQIGNLKYEIASAGDGGSGVRLIRSYDTIEATDNMAYSALASLLKFHRKDKTDENPYLQKFLKGIEVGQFTEGLLGTGGAIYPDEDGNSHAEFDYITIRKLATFVELIVQEARHVGGTLIVSPCGMKVSTVEDTGTAYRCYFDRTDGDRTLQNQFTVGTQARRQTYNLTTQAYYWRLVTAVGDDWVELSKTDCDTGSTVPQSGDELVGLGHRTDKTRQSAIVISAYGDGSPSIMYYQGIDSYSLEGKAVKSDYYDSQKGRFVSKVYGDTYIGNADGSTYLKYDQEEGMELKGRMNVSAGSTGAANFTDLPEEIRKAAEVGSVNLLYNSGFTGDYRARTLNSSQQLESDTELYSNALQGWDGEAEVISQSSAVSGRAAVVGNLSQTVESLIADENYVVSFRASGSSLTVSLGSDKETVALTSEATRYTVNLTFSGTRTFSISGNATVYDLQLERGNIATDWSPSPLDNDKTLAEFLGIQYITDAIRNGSVDVIGGLILANMIQLGNYRNGAMQQVTAGVSGLYNDDESVAFWAGGTFTNAINTVRKIMEGGMPDAEEWKDMANFVATHGGDIILRGYIYALGGYFSGMIDVAGKFRVNTDGSGYMAGGNRRWLSTGLEYQRAPTIIEWISVKDYTEHIIDYSLGSYINLSVDALSDQQDYTLNNPVTDGFMIGIKCTLYTANQKCAKLKTGMRFSAIGSYRSVNDITRIEGNTIYIGARYCVFGETILLTYHSTNGGYWEPSVDGGSLLVSDDTDSEADLYIINT